MKKKILIMSFGSDAGGIERSLIEFLKHLTKKNISVDLYLWRPPGILYSQIPKDVIILNTKLVPGAFSSCLSSNILVSLFQICWYLFFRICRLFGKQIKAFRKLQTKYDIAISYCQNGYSPYYVIDKVMAKEKYLWYHHGAYEGSEKDKQLDTEYFSKYNKVITVSQANKIMLSSLFPNIASKITVIPNIIDEDRIITFSQQ